MEKTPSEQIPFAVDWTKELPTGVTITASSWVLQAGSELVQLSATTDPAGKVNTIMLDKGRYGGPWEVKNVINRSDGVVGQERSLFIEVVRYKTK